MPEKTCGRSLRSPLQRIFGALKSICIIALLATPLLAEGDSKKVVVMHVFGKKAEKESVPKELEAFKSKLMSGGMNSFVLSRQDPLTLSNGASQSVSIPQSLGTATLTLDEDSRIRLEIANPKKESLGKLRSPLPVIHVNEKIKTSAQEVYIIIVKSA
ncbi:MAG: hypothetical protein L0Z55_07500 [Planctomycetes bacterium]|nr:hypothetical protein [Planctomycetota bacterium]